MKTKLLELRDRATFIPLLCVDMNPENDEQRYLLRRVGYPCDGKPNIAICHAGASGEKLWNDPYGWNGSRTYPAAHHYIIEHWNSLNDGDVIDVEYILGESTEKKLSEKVTT